MVQVIPPRTSKHPAEILQANPVWVRKRAGVLDHSHRWSDAR